MSASMCSRDGGLRVAAVHRLDIDTDAEGELRLDDPMGERSAASVTPLERGGCATSTGRTRSVDLQCGLGDLVGARHLEPMHRPPPCATRPATTRC
jgi:hypothetical protein